MIQEILIGGYKTVIFIIEHNLRVSNTISVLGKIRSKL